MRKTITTSKQLKDFLSNIISNSIVIAKDELDKINENSFTSLLEQESAGPEEEPEETEEVEEEVEEEAEEEKNPMKRKPKADLDRPKAGSEVRLTHILSAVNQIRSGRSLKDPDVREELKVYFDGLDNPERIALSEFLDGLTDVIVKGVPGDEAEVPSEEVKMKEPESSKEDKDNKIDDASKSEKPKDEEKSAAPAEDLTPPIQVRR